ncbi:MAG: helix-turn-helix domain-containing protein [Bdellovibrio sp.]
MLLNQETLRLVFGLKLRSMRVDKELSLKDLAKKTGLSPSYLNEIEKGKKYPRTEKILLLAEALDRKIEDLISLELKKELQLIQQLIDKKFLVGLPFDVFGIPAVTVFELLAEHPQKMQALIGTLIEIARAHDIEVDDLFYALLRSYLDMHKNYFPDLEAKAEKARVDFSLAWDQPAPELKDKLTSILETHYKVKVHDQKYLRDISPEFEGMDYFITEKGRSLYISRSLSLKEQIFILSRELGYHYMKMKIRPICSLMTNLDSFEQLFNHFSANYFASSLLIPENIIAEEVRKFLHGSTWRQEGFLNIIEKFSCTMESFFHRLSQILPHALGLENLFFLRYEYDLSGKRYQISRELHLSALHSPHKVKGVENYCNRWLVHTLTQKMMAQPANSKATLVGAQRSKYADSENEYLVFAAAFRNEHSSNKVSCVCLGLLHDDVLKQNVSLLEDASIPNMIVGETCERCLLNNCSDRQAPLNRELNPRRYQEIFKRIQELDQISE